MTGRPAQPTLSKLNPRRRKLIREFVKSGNATEAAIKAGYSKNRRTAESTASAILSNPIIKRPLMEAYAAAGITDKLLAKVTLDGLRAKETRFFAHNGRVYDKRTVVDHVTRHSFLETTHKTRGDYAPDKLEVMDYITAIKTDRAALGFEQPAGGAKK